ncbi:L,D-transpeptidase family protein [Streptomyces sp. NPDC093085]|uniref:L,D-transpeptidase family protein n=1 Tax=Streptomyces sp. NPDC093085 TaxID=3155068 RepID=UPI00342EB3CB
MLAKTALRRGFAAVAVLAASVGCTVQPATGEPGADGKGTHPLKVSLGPAPEPPAPAPATTATPAAPTPYTPSERPATRSPEPPAPKTTAPPAAPVRSVPRTLMAAGTTSDQVRELQARLGQIGYFDRAPTGYYGSVTANAVGAFQAKRGLPRTGTTDTVTWERLRAMTRTPTADELDPPTTKPVAKPDPRCLTGRVMCISKKSSTLAWMVNGKVQSAMDVRFGSEYTPTREGEFQVGWKSRDHVSTLYDSPMPYAMFFSGGQAVHYSSDFAARGYSGASHGCVNVRDEKKIAALFADVRTGDKVVIYW